MGVGMLRVARAFRPVVISILPPDHRVIAERTMDDGDCDMMVSGPMLPAFDGPQPFVADLAVRQTDAGDGTTYWASWTHSPEHEWPVRDPWEKVGLGCD